MLIRLEGHDRLRGIHARDILRRSCCDVTGNIGILDVLSVARVIYGSLVWSIIHLEGSPDLSCRGGIMIGLCDFAMSGHRYLVRDLFDHKIIRDWKRRSKIIRSEVNVPTRTDSLREVYPVFNLFLTFARR